MPELKELYLGYNKIKNLVGLDLPNLIVMHLRGNLVKYFFINKIKINYKIIKF